MTLEVGRDMPVTFNSSSCTSLENLGNRVIEFDILRLDEEMTMVNAYMLTERVALSLIMAHNSPRDALLLPRTSYRNRRAECVQRRTASVSGTRVG